MLKTVFYAARDLVRYLLFSWLRLLSLDTSSRQRSLDEEKGNININGKALVLLEDGSQTESETETETESPTELQPSIVFGAPANAPQMSIHAAFAQHAAAHPGNVAVTSTHLSAPSSSPSDSLTYAQLSSLSLLLASRLRSLGVKRGTRVLLLVSRSPAMVVGIFGALRAGASYVPLDGGIVTDETLNGIVEDARPVVVLALTRFVRRVEGMRVEVVDVQKFVEENVNVEESERENFEESTLENEAYVIYTSGTTGRPKGVSVTHGNVTNLILTSPGNLSIHLGTRVSQLLNISFDMAAWEILGCLSNGGTLVLRPSGMSCKGWEDTLRDVNVVIATPSILAQFDLNGVGGLGGLGGVRIVAVAGERCDQRLADEWARGREFWNCCGPTETTIINTAHLHTPGSSNTIGKPTPGNAVYVLDAALRPVTIGTPGTLWAGGRGVCKGYVGLPGLTGMKFREDPFGRDGGVMYNTGDIGRLRADGELDHLGREDDQVKIKGFRVELDGVAAALASCPGVVASAALLVGNELWGFYVPADLSLESEVKEEEVDVEEVERCVRRVQPYYAVPGRWMRVDGGLPLTKNGKVDKALLRAWAEAQTLSGSRSEK